MGLRECTLPQNEFRHDAHLNALTELSALTAFAALPALDEPEVIAGLAA